MKPISSELVFLPAKRTPFGTYGGALKDVSATDLGVHAAKAAIKQSGVKPEEIDNVVFGNEVQTSADAISVDQLNDLGESRKILTDTLLFGNIDPVATLWHGDEAAITKAVHAAKEAGVDAVWPGCDLVPQTPVENLKAFATG